MRQRMLNDVLVKWNMLEMYKDLICIYIYIYYHKGTSQIEMDEKRTKNVN